MISHACMHDLWKSITFFIDSQGHGDEVVASTQHAKAVAAIGKQASQQADTCRGQEQGDPQTAAPARCQRATAGRRNAQMAGRSTNGCTCALLVVPIRY
jgi:hypothetical protein